MEREIIIIGGGFAGINLAMKLRNKKGYHIMLVDQHNYNFFTPLLYQVSTGFLDVSSISTPFRSLFKKVKNIRFRMGKLEEVLPQENKIRLSNGELQYDLLVIATGTKSNSFGMKNIEDNALPMKTIDDAVTMRNYLLQKAEEASYTKDKERKTRMKNIVISGAGPSGVEVAGMLAEMRQHIFGQIYPELAKHKFEIYLIDGTPTVLPPMREKTQKYTQKTLEKMGVHVELGKMVEDYKEHTVYLKGGETIQTETLIWTAGVTGMRFAGLPEDSYQRGNRLLVDDLNRVQGTDNIYAIGDACVQMTDSGFPKGHPQLASVARQQGLHIARNFLNMAKGKPQKPFKYNDKGSMAIIGQSKAVADLTRPEKTFTGWIAWMMWLFIHILLLINYRSRIQTLWNWAVAYFSRDQSLGMIVRTSQVPKNKE